LAHNSHLDSHFKDLTMGAYSVAEAKAQLSALLQAVELGEEVTITRRGVAVAVVSPVHKAPAGINWERIQACQLRTAPTALLAKPSGKSSGKTSGKAPIKQAMQRDWAAVLHEMREE
jgi:prevent-host-death family protein